MRAVVRAFAAVLISAVAGAVIFAAAGRTDLPWVWGFLALHAAFMVPFAFAVLRDLVRERLNPPAEGRVHDHHRVLVLPLILASWVLTGMDLGRAHWSDTIPVALRWVGLGTFAVGMLLTIWAVASNRFYSSVIRIQRDRGQLAVTAGPYRVVRHPGYAGTVLCLLGGGLALGSWIGIVPLLGVVALFIRRTLTEDGLLRRELAGYADYAVRVPRRLVPGCW